MKRYVLFDSGPLGLAVCRTGTTGLSALETRLTELEKAGVTILIPAVIDYELRRELVRVGATTKLRKLNGLQIRFSILPITPAAWLRAAEFWALTRRMGIPPDRTRTSTRTRSWRAAPPRSAVLGMRSSSPQATSDIFPDFLASRRTNGHPSGLEAGQIHEDEGPGRPG